MELPHRIRTTVAVLVLAAIAGGCSWNAGDATLATATTDVPSSITTAGVIPEDTGERITLRIAVKTARASEHRVYTVHCNPAGGTLPRAATACRGYRWLAGHTGMPKRCADLPDEILEHAASRITGDVGGQPVLFDI